MPYHRRTLPIKYHGNPTQEHVWTSNEGFDIDNILDTMNEMADDYYRRGHRGEIMLRVLLPSRKGGPGKWRTPFKLTEITEENNFNVDVLAEGEDYWGNAIGGMQQDEEYAEASIKAFSIVVTKKGRAQGGKDINNDCLYNCLKKLIPDKLKKVFETPEDLKIFCGLDRDEAVPLEKIEEIEAELPDCRISIYGDYVQPSSKQAIITITLNLRDEHYSIAEEKYYNVAKGIALSEKPPAIFQSNSQKVMIFDGKKIRQIPFHLFRQWRMRPRSAPYIFIKSNGTDLKEQYEKFISEADLLKEKTDGKYNLYKCGTQKKAALHRFFELNKGLVPDEIKQDEAQWISDCNLGGMLWATKGYQGPGYKYDINSAYPQVLSNQYFAFPVKRGKFKRISQKEFDDMTHVEYGIYRAKIYGADNRLLKTTKPLKTKDPKFTHFELTRAKELGYKIEIINDGKLNLLSYAGPNMRAQGTVLKQYIDELYQLKSAFRMKVFKMQLNILWGALCERNKISKWVPKGEEYSVPENMIFTHFAMSGENMVVKMIRQDDQFNTRFARIAPFLTSRCRCMMSRIIEPHLKNIVRVHTDGFISKEELSFEKKGRKIDSVKIGKQLGDLKFEGYSPHIHVHNVNKIEF